MKIKTIGIDLAKDVFGVHGVDARGKALVHRRVTRKHLLGLLAKLEPCLVGMEACGSAHHWAREIEQLGHTVKLMSPQFVKPKNILCQIDADCLNLHPWTLLRCSVRMVEITILAHL